jgi:hypothetical protein
MNLRDISMPASKDEIKKNLELLRSMGREYLCEVRKQIQQKVDEGLMQLEKKFQLGPTWDRIRKDSRVQDILEKSRPIAERIFSKADGVAVKATRAKRPGAKKAAKPGSRKRSKAAAKTASNHAQA